MSLPVRVIVLLVTILCCVSRLCAQTDSARKTFPFRDYATHGVSQNPIDSYIIKTYYHEEVHPRDTAACIRKTRTSIECDSFILFIVDEETKVFASLFTRGIISGKKLYGEVLASGPLAWAPRFDENWKPVYETEKRKFWIGQMEMLDCIETQATKRFFKFYIYASVFYVELTNEAANKHTRIKKFIKRARLTWLFKSPQHVANQL